jgi:predicted small secreted protein
MAKRLGIDHMKRFILLIAAVIMASILVSSCSIVNSITSKINTGGNGEIASVGKLYIDSVWSNNGGQIDVPITPGKLAVADTSYTVQLFEKGSLRAASTVSWNQPQINVATSMIVQFPCSYVEWQAYNGKDLSGTFSVKVIQ